MLHICCIRAGEAFSPAYVNILFDSVRRNLAEGFEGDFVCFTDQPDNLDPGIVRRPLPADLPGWWSKIALLRNGLFPDGDRVLFLDLDSVITGRLDEIAAYDGPFAILRDFFRPDGLQSAVMAWEAGTMAYVWHAYEANGCATDIPGGDQAFIEACLKRGEGYVHPYGKPPFKPVTILQDAFPDLFCSYKRITGAPDKASVVVFHGKPRPHEVVTGWVPEVWKIGGLTRVQLDAVCNTSREEITRNVVSATARPVRWFDFDDTTNDGHVAIIGGGPSLLDKLPEIAWRQSIGQAVWALNGAAETMTRNGIRIDAHVILDARPENANFLNGYAREYLIASQCAPEVLDRIDPQFVTLWHPHIDGMQDLLAGFDDRPIHLIGGGTTVGMLAMSLAFLRGYRKIHLYGIDSCYRGDEHHAFPQSMNDGERILDVMFEGQKYRCAPWMAGQADEFQALAGYMMGEGAIITAHGDGLIQAIAMDLMTNTPATPAQQRAHEVIARLNGAAHPRGAEIGVFAGDMSAALLAANPKLHLDMVDSWEGGGEAYIGDSGDWHAGLTQDSQDAYMAKAERKTAFASDRRSIIRSRSVEAAVSPYIYDFVFLDADHSYAGCAADIAAWSPKVKPGGWLGGHDYENTGFPKFGVTQAVNEYVASTGLKLELGDNFTWFVKIPHTPSEGN